MVMDTQALTQALQALDATQQTLSVLASIQTALLVGLVLVALVGVIWLGIELRTIRHMLVYVQTSAERIAEMTRDVLRRVEDR
jgi:hypothetical protein